MNTVEPIRDTGKIEAMKRYLKGQSIRDWLMFTMGINSALRVSDLLKLRERDCFDGKGKVLDVIRLRESKTTKEKVFAINKSAKKALEEYYVSTKDHDPDNYLFASRKGTNKPISRGQAWEVLSQAAKSVGIDYVGTHSMRKTFGYQARQAGYDIEILMKLFNHSSQAITLRYLGITEDDVNNVYVNLNL